MNTAVIFKYFIFKYTYSQNMSVMQGLFASGVTNSYKKTPVMFLLFIQSRSEADKEMKVAYTTTILTNSQIRDVT